MLNIEFEQAYENINLNINLRIKSMRCAIVGPSGAGKTSVFDVISGLKTPTKGKVVFGKDVLYSSEEKVNIPIHKRRIGYVRQKSFLVPHLTVEDNITMGCNIDNKDYIDILNRLDIKDILRKQPGELSGGELRRVDIARMLSIRPRLFLIDEGLSSLNENLRECVLKCIIDKCTKWNARMMIITHNQLYVKGYVDSVIKINNGKIINGEII
ncbi:ATP-binding cassette domain-containing protein [Oceanirhabdus sp. W0125-5]|uniref:ATP-binding cassette domain-containing protein n=1 Tax=Oceanirhabdus sp. W0125-5 TaxID=2999116 RepID=UPI0022F2EA75|nr:ATP-binding cassette domain-containing protein [Oceanirhabdus sp. W0125-5]WBW97867.1 ATP-binding cassette domain-containing protein [Oceanirhabdus sp. W0125-5]